MQYTPNQPTGSTQSTGISTQSSSTHSNSIYSNLQYSTRPGWRLGTVSMYSYFIISYSAYRPVTNSSAFYEAPAICSPGMYHCIVVCCIVVIELSLLEHSTRPGFISSQTDFGRIQLMLPKMSTSHSIPGLSEVIGRHIESISG
jgi:hypothetical protein